MKDRERLLEVDFERLGPRSFEARPPRENRIAGHGNIVAATGPLHCKIEDTQPSSNPRPLRSRDAFALQVPLDHQGNGADQLSTAIDRGARSKEK